MKEKNLIILLLFIFCKSIEAYSETYTLGVGESVTVSQTPYNGGYISNVGLESSDAHLSFTKNYDGSATLTVNSYFDYTATVNLVFLETYQSYYSGRNHTRVYTYRKSVQIKCKYQSPRPNVKPTKVTLPERIRVPIFRAGDDNCFIEPILEPYGAKGTKYYWEDKQGSAFFVLHGNVDSRCMIVGRSPGIGSISVTVDDKLKASAILEIVDPDNMPPNAVFLPDNIEISVNGHTKLEPILVPENTSTSYTWKSADKSVATVSYGKVSGVKVGKTTITLKTKNELEATCTVNVVSANGRDDEDDDDTNYYGNIGGHDYVDLGLSVKWATCNVGAANPEEAGSYFAWGEIVEKSEYTWDTYKYGRNPLDVDKIGMDIKATEYDAAYVNWSKDWRMPTEAEAGELISKCQFKADTRNGIEGYTVTGPNGASIFFPKHKEGSSYWTSSCPNQEESAITLYFIKDKYGQIKPATSGRYRMFGYPIRPVIGGDSPSTQDIGINVTNFPDENFRKYLLEQDYGKDGVISKEEIANITYIDVSNCSITDMKGIEFFTSLKDLWCYDNEITSLDLSNNTVLSTVSCKNNKLVTLDVSKNTALRYLDCDKNQLKNLDVSKNLSLISLSCGDNQLVSLDVSKNTTLESLHCYNNQLTSIDVTNNKVLNNLTCSSNQLTTLNVSKNINLSVLYIGSNQLRSLDLSKNTTLEELYCEDNQLTTLNLSNNPSLKRLFCGGNQLTSLDVTSNANLNVLRCGINQLTTLYLRNREMVYLDVNNNKLTSLDVSNNIKLVTFECASNKLTSLDVSNNIKLETLGCASNKLTSLNVSQNTELKELRCSGNMIKGSAMDALIASLPIRNANDGKVYIVYTSSDEGNVCTKTQVAAIRAKGWIPYSGWGEEYAGSEPGSIAIDATNFPDDIFRKYLLEQDYGKDGVLTEEEIEKIKYIACYKKEISNLKGIEYFTSLEKLYCYSNKLTSLDISKNTALLLLYCGINQLTSLDVSKNTELKELSCGFNQLTSLDVSKNTALTELDCGFNQLTSLDVSKNTELTELSCSDNQLTSLDVSKNTALTELSCGNVQLTSLDVSKNTALTKLNCSINQLISLDLSKNTALTELDCSFNQLTSLDLSKNTALTELDCSDNQLTSLDLSKNTALTELDCYRNQLTSLDVSKNAALTELYCYKNKIEGVAMDKLISSLPIRNTNDGIFRVIMLSSTEENVCTTKQVAEAKKRGWISYCYENRWVEYEGSDPSSIGGVLQNITNEEPVFNLNGQRLDKPRKGINIIGGKKVIVK